MTPSAVPSRFAISIHAPTRGATLAVMDDGRYGLISIHAPTRGATLLSTVLKLSERFQSTLLQEERREKI